METELIDLRKCVLAENVTVVPNPVLGGYHDITFDWLCANCGEYHHGRELGCRPGFDRMGTTLNCGWCWIRMPWAKLQQHMTVPSLNE
jgi:hypothetical protein